MTDYLPSRSAERCQPDWRTDFSCVHHSAWSGTHSHCYRDGISRVPRLSRLRLGGCCLCRSISIVKTTGMGHATNNCAEQLPLLLTKLSVAMTCFRTLMLNCLTTHYADLWRECWDPAFHEIGWAKDDPRLDNDTLRDVSRPNGTAHCRCAPTTSAVRRSSKSTCSSPWRSASRSTSSAPSTASSSRSCARTSTTPSMTRTAASSSPQQGPTGRRLQPPEFERIKTMKSGTVERTVTDDTLPGARASASSSTQRHSTGATASRTTGPCGPSSPKRRHARSTHDPFGPSGAGASRRGRVPPHHVSDHQSILRRPIGRIAAHGRQPFQRTLSLSQAAVPIWRSLEDALAGIVPDGFVPHRHQERSWQRLRADTARSTIVATGTGSGKTECFLYPVLDYCHRHRGERGIKAIIVYPMNALATDQARPPRRCDPCESAAPRLRLGGAVRRWPRAGR